MGEGGFILNIQYEEVKEDWWEPRLKLRASLVVTGIWWLAIATEFLVF